MKSCVAELPIRSAVRLSIDYGDLKKKKRRTEHLYWKTKWKNYLLRKANYKMELVLEEFWR